MNTTAILPEICKQGITKTELISTFNKWQILYLGIIFGSGFIVMLLTGAMLGTKNKPAITTANFWILLIVTFSVMFLLVFLLLIKPDLLAFILEG